MYDVRDMHGPRVIHEPELVNEKSDHSPSDIAIRNQLELEANRARIGNTKENLTNMEAERARLVAEQKAIISKQAEQVKARTYDFESVVEERKDLANTDLSHFLDSF